MTTQSASASPAASISMPRLQFEVKKLTSDIAPPDARLGLLFCYDLSNVLANVQLSEGASQRVVAREEVEVWF